MAKPPSKMFLIFLTFMSCFLSSLLHKVSKNFWILSCPLPIKCLLSTSVPRWKNKYGRELAHSKRSVPGSSQVCASEVISCILGFPQSSYAMSKPAIQFHLERRHTFLI